MSPKAAIVSSQRYLLAVLLFNIFFFLRRIQKEEHGSQTVPTPLQGSPFRALKLPEPVLINEDFVKLLHNATYEKGIGFIGLHILFYNSTYSVKKGFPPLFLFSCSWAFAYLEELYTGHGNPETANCPVFLFTIGA